MSIRRLGAEEWRLLRETRLTALLDSPLAFGRSYEQEIDLTDADWQERGRQWAYFVASEQDEVTGIIAGTWFDADAPSLHCMWVAPSHRGSGLAVDLANAVISWARSEGVSRLVLHTASDNIPAMHFYEKIGFERTGRAINMGSRPETLAPELAMNLDDA